MASKNGAAILAVAGGVAALASSAVVVYNEPANYYDRSRGQGAVAVLGLVVGLFAVGGGLALMNQQCAPPAPQQGQ